VAFERTQMIEENRLKTLLESNEESLSPKQIELLNSHETDGGIINSYVQFTAENKEYLGGGGLNRSTLDPTDVS
jgi:hypothetical protein